MRAAQAGASFHPAALKATGGQGAGRNPVMAGENKQAWSRKPSPLQRTTLQPPQLQECLLTRSRLTEDNEAGENLNSLGLPEQAFITMPHLQQWTTLLEL
ncbi:mCG55779, isoform CRA_b [Mus musculus]|uniref:Uncharacterized protein n=1 Tax=Mus musculus TaxID=10090 RepID=Q8BT94_MOUSE|nr:mCG55779, isoform CRA_b [Mus musculus]BAC25366.1 unnamed protein product [Mus musculus]